MADDFDPAEIAKSLNQPTGGLRKKCTDDKRCGLGNICEHAQHRDQTVELVSLWGGTSNECPNYLPRRELRSESDIFRPKYGRRHNPLRRSNLFPPGLAGKEPPDLNVSRHLRSGRNIKEDD